MTRTKKLLTALLLLLTTLSAAAAEPVTLRGCRMGVAGHQPSTAKHLMRHKRAEGGESPYVGDRRQLVVLVSFSDQQFRETEPLTLWNRIFNEEQLREPPFHGSVRDYFQVQSYGQLRLTFDLHYVSLTESRVKYRSTAEDDENSKYLVQDLVEALQRESIDWSPYDWDGDGYVDQLLIVYAGKGMNAGGDRNTIWPHQWSMTDHEGVDPISVTSGNRTFWVDKYCCVQELYSGNDYGSFGTICHEYSHCFGFPDFYYGTTSYVHSWDLMDYGNNSQGGFCPPNYSAHERWLMGWLTPTELTEPATITGMASTSTEPTAYIIRNDGCPTEHYLVEYRQQLDWDSSLPGSGVVIFHVDYDENVWLKEMPNTPQRQRYTIFPANNRTAYYFEYGWAYPYGTSNALTDDSTPAAKLLNENSDGRLLMGKPLTNISVKGGFASFDFMGGTSGINSHSVADGQRPQTLYRLGPIRVVRGADGVVRKLLR